MVKQTTAIADDVNKKPRPHRDQSTFTINLALNERGVDYEVRSERTLSIRNEV